MKNKIVIFLFLSITLLSCKDEEVVAPTAEYDIQFLNAATGQYENVAKPYELDINTKYRVLSHNSSRYNSFYTGDSTLANNITTYRIYSKQPLNNHQGLALTYNQESNNSSAEFSYLNGGLFKATFVATAVGDNGNTVNSNVDSTNLIAVYPIFSASAETNLAGINGFFRMAFDGDEKTQWQVASPTGWIQAQTKSAVAYNSYTLVSRYSGVNYDPKSWELKGSNDGINWDVLHSITAAPNVAARTKRTYPFANTTPYKYYQLNVTASVSPTKLAVAEIYLEVE